MRPALCLVLAAVAASSGCALQTVQALSVSGDFTEKEFAVIEAAAEAWCEADASTCVPVVRDEPGWSTVELAEVGDPRCETALGYTLLNPTFQPKLRICPDVRDELPKIILHELGHAFAGRAEHLGPGNVMSDEEESLPEAPTGQDVAYLHAK